MENLVQKEGIKEISEVLKGLQVVGVAGCKILADGKVGAADIPAFVDLAKQYQVVLDAVDGADKIPLEVKDLDMIELAAIGAQAMEMVKAIQAARKV